MKTFNLFDFDKLADKTYLTMYLDGFKNPLKVEYVIYKLHNENYLYWRVHGINDVLKIPLKDVYKSYGERFDLFIQTSLESFKTYHDTIKIKPNKSHQDIEVLNYLQHILY